MAGQVSERVFDPGRPGGELVETHVSTLAFDGDLVHKRKKPVRFAFVDLSTTARREETCHREVALNRRFSPDVYLGVEDVVDDAGAVVDHAVLMRRMPVDRRLAALVRRGADVSGCLRAVARTMAACHAEAATDPDIAAVATPEGLTRLWSGNLAELAPFTPDPLDPAIVAHVGELAHRYVTGRTVLLAERIAGGRVIDGHGDLLADDIFCLDDGPRILDGLEFDDHLRWGDVLYDVGFLAMDLERLDRPDLALAFLDWYREYSAEVHPRSLEHHYVAYRALVRSKISCLRGGAEGAAAARAHLAQCRRHLRAGRIRLVVVGGLPGTGKSTLAAAIGDRMGWPVLRSDELRKGLAGLDPLTPSPAAYGEGIYAPATSDATYAELLRRASRLLARGETVLLDASFSTARRREDAAALAGESWADLIELCCELPADVASARLRRRIAEECDASDATPDLAAKMATTFDAWPSATRLSTLPPLDEILPVALGCVDAEPGWAR
jgi:aminoglycoside phosphotransferase family enzyme/predicted kinase